MAKRKDKNTGNLFIDGSGQLDLLDKSYEQELKEQKQKKVECLGQTFENDDARREYFTNKLRQGLEELHEKLAIVYEDAEQAFGVLKSVENWPMGEDARLRKLAEKMRFADDSNKDVLQRWKDEIGFPHGEIDDIINLSDPPYYTACPNPFLGDFVKQYGRPYDPMEGYKREPFAADVKEGKNDPIYNAHSYHTKVPHKAIMRYILHYTEPGDLVFDGFCGTGMTGIAAQMCGDKATVESLGYEVKGNGIVLDEEGKPFSKLGTRKAILNDLSPIATFISYNYNTPVNVYAFEKEAKRILKEVEKKCGWMYETRSEKGSKGKINYTVWSDVFVCPECTSEVIFWEAAVDKEAGKVRDVFPCPHCNAKLTKRKMDRAWITRYDSELKESIKQAKQVPVLINYGVEGAKGRYEKSPDEFDLALIDKIENSDTPYWFPTDRMMKGKETRRNDPAGITHVHHFYTKRANWELGALWESFTTNQNRELRALRLSLTAASPYASKLRRFRAGKKGGGPLAGTLYLSSLITPPNVLMTVGRNTGFIANGFRTLNSIKHNYSQSCQSNENFHSLPERSLDYIFLDPPFGANLNYSELNFLWESWLKVWTNNKPEAIENSVQKKGPDEYRHLMTGCFHEAFRVLKPGRWMTVEFSNTKASVWNSIQTALTEAGFIVANVSALDKKQGSFKAVTTPTAVKQDLVISAYKPNGGLEERFEKEAETEEGVWDFVRTHLKYLPVFKGKTGMAEFIPERDPRILFDQLISYYVRHGIPVPISSTEFQAGLRERFAERDGMYFMPDQAAEYDRKRMLVKDFIEAKLFVDDEASAIQWLRQQFMKKPQTFQEIQPQFMQQISGWNKNEQMLELSKMLEDNFIRYDGNEDVPSQIHSYLSTNFKELRNKQKDDPALKRKAKDRWYVPDPNKEADLEKKREKALLREFEEYRQEKKKKLKVFRLEAVRAGFKKAYQDRDYQTIIDIAEKIPEASLQEDQKLLMWYDQAITRTGGDI